MNITQEHIITTLNKYAKKKGFKPMAKAWTEAIERHRPCAFVDTVLTGQGRTTAHNLRASCRVDIRLFFETEYKGAHEVRTLDEMAYELAQGFCPCNGRFVVPIDITTETDEGARFGRISFRLEYINEATTAKPPLSDGARETRATEEEQEEKMRELKTRKRKG